MEVALETSTPGDSFHALPSVDGPKKAQPNFLFTEFTSKQSSIFGALPLRGGELVFGVIELTRPVFARGAGFLTVVRLPSMTRTLEVGAIFCIISGLASTIHIFRRPRSLEH